MSRRKTTQGVLKTLFALTGNRCAFPRCTFPIVDDQGSLVGDVCHIEAAEPDGPRYNPDQTDQARRAAGNLLVLCPTHHRVVDVGAEFTAARLREMKKRHEARCRRSGFRVSGATIRRAAAELDAYWLRIDLIHKTEHVADNLKVPIDTKASFVDLARQIREALANLQRILGCMAEGDQRLHDDVKAYVGAPLFAVVRALRRFRRLSKAPAYADDIVNSAFLRLERMGFPIPPEQSSRIRSAMGQTLRLLGAIAAIVTMGVERDPFFSRNWEIYHIGVPNHFTTALVRLDQLEILFLGLHVQAHPDDKAARQRLKELQADFEKSARSAGHAD